MNLDQLPERMESRFAQNEPDEDIFLTEVPVKVEFGAESYRGQGKVFLTCYPSPRLLVRTDIEPSAITAMRFIADDLSAVVEVQGITGDWRVVHLSPVTASAFQTEPPSASDLIEVQFHIINFADYIGTKTRFSNTGLSASRLTLDDGQWRVILDSSSVTREKVKILKSRGGYAITHVGQLTRPSDSVFTDKEVQAFLKTFTRFLAFVQGRWAPPAIMLGYNSDGEQVWTRWESIGNSEPWHYVSSWFEPIEAPEILPPVFAGYRNLIKDPDWREVFSKAVYWYVLANSIRNFDAGLILAQAALELLSWNLLVRDKKLLSKNAFSRQSASDRFRRLLSFCGIPVDVPNGLTELGDYARAHLRDGPGSLTLVRNRLVHPGKQAAEGKVALEARELALWYTELVLLKLFNYSGRYASRVLDRPRFPGEIVPVPWSTNKP